MTQVVENEHEQSVKLALRLAIMMEVDVSHARATAHPEAAAMYVNLPGGRVGGPVCIVCIYYTPVYCVGGLSIHPWLVSGIMNAAVCSCVRVAMPG